MSTGVQETAKQEEATADVSVEMTGVVYYSKAEQEHYHEILDQEKIVRALREKWERAKEKAKAAKESYENQNSELADLIRRGPDAQRKLLGMEDVDKRQDWREVPLFDLVLPVAALKAFEEPPAITTIGELVEYQNEGDGRPLTDRTGIGPFLAETISERLTQFWEDHPEFTDEAKPDDDDSGSEPTEE